MPNLTRPLARWLPVLTLLAGCREYAFYQSPMLAQTDLHRTIPMQGENIPSATYVSAASANGRVNDNLRDRVHALFGSIHRSHNFRPFQAYYAVNGDIGVYGIGRVYNFSFLESPNVALNPEAVNPFVGNAFFGAYGGATGINIVSPIRGGEWRVIGADVYYHREFGEYLRFRKQLPDRSVNLADQRNHQFMISLSTAFVFHSHTGETFGYRLAYVRDPARLRGYDYTGSPAFYSAGYFSNTFHIHHKRLTGSLQGNFGFKATSLNLGGSYQLGPASSRAQKDR